MFDCKLFLCRDGAALRPFLSVRLIVGWSIVLLEGRIRASQVLVSLGLQWPSFWQYVQPIGVQNRSFFPVSYPLASEADAVTHKLRAVFKQTNAAHHDLGQCSVTVSR